MKSEKTDRMEDDYMRKGLQKVVNENNNYRIIAVDDEEGIVDSLSI